jgi:hypothetical protein
VERYGFPDQLITDKGREWAVVAFVCYLVERYHNRPPPAGGGRRARRARRAWRRRRRPHRYVKSKRNVCCWQPALPCAAHPAAAHDWGPHATNAQVVVERFNDEINIRVLIPMRAALFKLERLRLLDKSVHAHVGAVQFLALPLLQYGCDLLRLSWNSHNRRIIRGVPGTGGRPEDLRRTRPHPGGQMRLPPGFNGLREYARAGGRINRVPQTAPLRDRLLYRRGRARRRARGDQFPMPPPLAVSPPTCARTNRPNFMQLVHHLPFSLPPTVHVAGGSCPSYPWR